MRVELPTRDQPTPVRESTGLGPDRQSASTIAPSGHQVLRVHGITKGFGHGLWPRRRRTEVLRGADLEVSSGELVGLVGENGSGKSVLMQIVVGLVKRDGGDVERPARLGADGRRRVLTRLQRHRPASSVARLRSWAYARRGIRPPPSGWYTDLSVHSGRVRRSQGSADSCVSAPPAL